MSDIIELPTGFEAGGLACGIKPDGVPDLALFASTSPCTAAAVFTQNRVSGAPVKVSQSRVPTESARAVLINSGNANACTGDRGLADAHWMTELAAQSLQCDARQILVCSTGVIGRYLPREPLATGIPQLVAGRAATPSAFTAAAEGMRTTDTVPKQSSAVVAVGGRKVRVSGAAKGAAMIAPNMATMLAVIMTDAPLTTEQANTMLRSSVNRSFNRISVEGHTSTSDTVVLLANGAAVDSLDEAAGLALQSAIDDVTRELAQAIVRDAEGADHFVEVVVRGLSQTTDAELVARTIANDVLVKTAVTGNDPNWGRIVSCVGRTGLDVSESDMALTINGTQIFDHGQPADYDEATVAASMRTGEVQIELRFDRGSSESTYWTSDLTQEYVRLNSEYTT